MKKIKAWRIFIFLITAVSLIFVIPWIEISQKSEKYFVSFSFDGLTALTITILVIGICYLLISFLATFLRNKAGKVFGVFNVLIGFLIVVILSVHTFASTNKIFVVSIRLSYFMSLFCLLVVDIVLSIINISINPISQQAQITQNLQSEQSLSEVVNTEINNIETQDVSELKNKILNIKSGLSKSYEEAIEEIERTGALSGLDMSELLKEDEKEEKNKIIPFSLNEDLVRQSQDNEQFFIQESHLTLNEQKNYLQKNESNTNFQDPLATSSSDYESIRSSNLARKQYKYTSRRKDIDDNKH